MLSNRRAAPADNFEVIWKILRVPEAAAELEAGPHLVKRCPFSNEKQRAFANGSAEKSR